LSKALAVAGIVSAIFVALFFVYGDPLTAINALYKTSPVQPMVPGVFPNNDSNIEPSAKQGIPSFIPNNSTNIELLIHQMINEHREAKGLQPLEWDEELAIVARNHSKDMAARGYFEHEDPEGRDHVYRYQDHNYQCGYASGENIFMISSRPVIGDSDEKIADTVVVGWMNSKGHRENILYDGFYNEGIGVHLELTDAHITQNFC
jgi:uncharacterized protein YkwD